MDGHHRLCASSRTILPLLAALFSALLACAPEKPPVSAPPVTREVPPKVGLALGGGAARGFAEIGVLRVLEQEKIPVHLVTGTSVGSLVGALYADSGRVLDAELLALQVEEEDLFDYRALALFSGGLVKGEKLESFLLKNLRHATLETLPIPLYPVAVDLQQGKAVVFERGSIAQAVHASCAIPGVFVPVQFGGRTYVDGGVLDPVPADVARQKGADVVIGVAIPAGLPQGTPRNPVEVAFHAAMIMNAEMGRLKAGQADVLIEPDVKGVAFDDFSQKKRLIEAGEEAARRALPAIRAAIAKKTRVLPVEAEP